MVGCVHDTEGLPPGPFVVEAQLGEVKAAVTGELNNGINKNKATENKTHILNLNFRLFFIYFPHFIFKTPNLYENI
jgi:hypothetical protein